ncbi:hypothetical protein [Trinickia sp.]|uniref:hypothetical protein n=1 Tax=Trinickia sp. TaxID=2571163 RepID=UPI003F7EE764
MVRTTQADGTPLPEERFELQPVGQRRSDPHAQQAQSAPSRPIPAHFGEGLKRLPDKLRDLGAHDFEVNSFVYSGRRFGKTFTTPNSKIEQMGPTPPALTAAPRRLDTVQSAATSSSRSDADMRRVVEAFASTSTTATADAAHARARSALSHEDAYLAEVIRQFPDGSRNATANPAQTCIVRALGMRIANVFAAPPPAPTAQRGEMAYTEALTGAEALALATGGDMRLAHQVLDRLERGLDLNALGTPDASASSSAPQPSDPAEVRAQAVERAAWRTAQWMAQTTNGYEALRRVAGQGWPQGEGVRHAPRVLLRAGDAIACTGRAEARPSDVLRLARQWCNDPAADATERHVGTMALAAAKLWQSGDMASLSPVETGAVFAGRHNFMTDGPGTAFAKVKSRLFKTIDTSIPRASASRWKTALPRVVGKRKTAFAVMEKGIRSAHLDIVEKERAALRASTDNALEALAAHSGADGSTLDATRSLAAIVARMTLTGGDAVSVLVERAEIARWTSRASHAYGDTLNDEDYEAIAEHVRRAFARLPVPPASAPLAEHAAWWELRRYAATLRAAPQSDGKNAWKPLRTRLAGRSATLDIDKLDAMAKHFPAAKAAAEADWKTITRIARAKAIEPNDLSAQGIKEALDELADTMKSGGKLVLVDGGQVGFSTAGLSANLGKLLHAGGIVLSPRLNLRVRGGRQAFAEYGRRTACFYFSAGSQDRLAFDAGAGLQVGGDYLIVRAGVTVNVVAYQTDRLNRNAFSLIVARRMKADGSGFDDVRLQRGMFAVNAFVFDHARDRDLADGEAAWQALAQTFLGNDDFSVVWNEQHQRERRHGVNISGGVSVKASVGEMSARIGPQFGYAYDYATQNIGDSKDAGGTTAVESHRSGRGGRHVASAGLSTSLGNSPNSTKDVVNFGILSSDFPMVRYRVRDRQHVAKMSLVREEGRIVHRVSYADTEFAHFDDYAHAIRNDERWALMFGLDPDHPVMPTDAQREAVLARGRARIETHLAEAKRDHKDNQILFYRFRLREHAAKQLDAYADRAAAVRMNGGSEEDVARWEHDYAEVLARPDSWLPVEFKVYERVGRQSSPGLNFGVRATLDQSATGERELVSMINKPAQIDAIDRVWPRQ